MCDPDGLLTAVTVRCRCGAWPHLSAVRSVGRLTMALTLEAEQAIAERVVRLG